MDAVFDLDGTLVDSVVQCRSILNAMRADRGEVTLITPQHALEYSAVSGRQMVAALLGECRQDADTDLAEFRARYAGTPTPVGCLFPGAADALETLSASGVRLSVCSAKPQALCERVLADVGLSVMFAAVLGSAPDRACKPDPAHLDATLAMVGGSRARACYIGDSEIDHALATNAGVPLVMVSHGYAAAGFDCAPGRWAARFAEVPGLVLEALR